MKKSLLKSIAMAAAAALCLTSCSNDEPTPVVAYASVVLEIPANLDNPVLSGAHATLTNVETQQVTAIDGANFIKDGNA